MTCVQNWRYSVENFRRGWYLEATEVPGLEDLPGLLHGGGECLRVAAHQLSATLHRQAGRTRRGSVPENINLKYYNKK